MPDSLAPDVGPLDVIRPEGCGCVVPVVNSRGRCERCQSLDAGPRPPEARPEPNVLKALRALEAINGPALPPLPDPTESPLVTGLDSHCLVTRNACGTDTWGDRPCPCANCQRWVMRELFRGVRTGQGGEK